MGSNIIIHPTRRQEIGFRNRFFGRVMMSVRPLKEHPYLKGIFDGLTTTS
jgi:hypothetical protein